jgi:hypothetical protein
MTGPIAGYNANMYIASGPLSLTNEAMSTISSTVFRVTNLAKRGLDTSFAQVVQIEKDEVWTVTITGSPSGGNFTLTFGAQTTSGIAYNASASVESAFEALSTVDDVTVTGSAGGPWTIEFVGTHAYSNVGDITASGAGLTGGSSPNAVPAKVQDGQGFTTVSASAYTIQYPIGQVTFASAQLGTPVARISSGKYLPFSFLAYCKAEEVTSSGKTIDVTSQKNPPDPWEDIIMGTNSSTVKISKFWDNGAGGVFLSHLDNSDLLILRLFPDANAAPYWAGYGVLTADAIKSALDAANTEDLDFMVNNQLYYVAS